MKEYNVRHVQHHLAALLQAVKKGEKVRITRRGKVVAQLSPPEPDPAQLNRDNACPGSPPNTHAGVGQDAGSALPGQWH